MRKIFRITESQLNRIVSESVKKTLMEENESMDNSIYVAINVEFSSVEDSYGEGEMGPENYWSENYSRITGKTVQELISNVAYSYGFDVEEAFVNDDRVEMECLADSDNVKLSQNEMEQWRNGSLKGYSFRISFNVAKRTPLSHDELVSNGLQEY